MSIFCAQCLIAETSTYIPNGLLKRTLLYVFSMRALINSEVVQCMYWLNSESNALMGRFHSRPMPTSVAFLIRHYLHRVTLSMYVLVDYRTTSYSDHGCIGLTVK
ncbi:hypothetical protein MHBO_004913 [Bonamia ostreae]|uniref:Uncharacterized protein n=1 Tax=Bonamia ostreae TaxID=126728 RepID=A0ABV2AUP6_9EUKA